MVSISRRRRDMQLSWRPDEPSPSASIRGAGLNSGRLETMDTSEVKRCMDELHTVGLRAVWRLRKSLKDFWVIAGVERRQEAV